MSATTEDSTTDDSTSTPRNSTEIWSTRVQRELLALTTGNESEASKEESVGLLPPFITLKEHNLNIADGICVLSFLIEIPNVDTTATTTDSEEQDTVLKITVLLNVSLEKLPDGKGVDPSATAYPFQEPNAVLSSGADYFPEGSTIKDGTFLPLIAIGRRVCT